MTGITGSSLTGLFTWTIALEFSCMPQCMWEYWESWQAPGTVSVFPRLLVTNLLHCMIWWSSLLVIRSAFRWFPLESRDCFPKRKTCFQGEKVDPSPCNCIHSGLSLLMIPHLQAEGRPCCLLPGTSLPSEPTHQQKRPPSSHCTILRVGRDMPHGHSDLLTEPRSWHFPLPPCPCSGRASQAKKRRWEGKGRLNVPAQLTEAVANLFLFPLVLQEEHSPPPPWDCSSPTVQNPVFWQDPVETHSRS